MNEEQFAQLVAMVAQNSPHNAGRMAGDNAFDQTLGQIPGLGDPPSPQYAANPLQANAAGLGRDEADRVLGAMGMGAGSPDVGPPSTFSMGPGGQMSAAEAQGMAGAVGPSQGRQGIDPNVLAALIQSMQAGGGR